jgi:hypothetical protein
LEAAALVALRLPILETMELAEAILFSHQSPQLVEVLDRPREVLGRLAGLAGVELVMAALDSLVVQELRGKVMPEEREQQGQILNMAQVVVVEKAQ